MSALDGTAHTIEELKKALKDTTSSVNTIRSDAGLRSLVGELQDKLFQIAPQRVVRKANERKTGFYDRILKDLLTSVRSATTREQFIDIFFDGLEERERERASDFVLLIEGYRASTSRRLTSAGIRRVIGGNLNRRRNASEAFRGRSSESPVIRALLEKGQPIDFLLTHLAGEEDYKNDFVELHGDSPKWICGVPLPSSKVGEPERAIVALFDATEDGSSIFYPRQALQEWFLMELVPDVYSMLEHQILSVEEQLETERKQLIMELAPTAINHEIGTSIGLIQDSVVRLAPFLTNLSMQENLVKDVDPILDEIVEIKRQSDRSRRVTQAFTNIERAAKERASVFQILDEVEIIFANHLSRNRIHFIVDGNLDAQIETEVSMFEHVILNVVKNAIDAISEYNGEEYEDLERLPDERHIWIDVQAKEPNLAVEIANDGPSIPDSMKVRMFQKGETSKPRGKGHGQGLYICRLVAAHLEGSFSLLDQDESKRGSAVTFLFEVPLKR